MPNTNVFHFCDIEPELHPGRHPESLQVHSANAPRHLATSTVAPLGVIQHGKSLSGGFPCNV